MPTNLLHHGSQNRFQKTSRNLAARKGPRLYVVMRGVAWYCVLLLLVACCCCWWWWGGGIGGGGGVGVCVGVTPAALFLGSVVAENRQICEVFACFCNSLVVVCCCVLLFVVGCGYGCGCCYCY